MQMLAAKSNYKIWTGKYSKGLRNQNGEHLVNLYESDNLEKQVVFPSKLTRTLFPKN